MTTLALLDTNAYLRLAKRIQPLLGMEFGQKKYELAILKVVEDEVSQQPRLQELFPWFGNEPYATERLARRVRLTKDQRFQVETAKSILLDYVANNVSDFTYGGRSPPGSADCFCLAFGQVRPAIVVTDDIGMHDLAAVFELPVWHGWEVLKKMRAAKVIDDNKVREIFEALENNGDMPKSWREARETEFKKVFR